MTAFRANALLVEGRAEESRAAYEQLWPLLRDPPADDLRWSGVLAHLIDLVEAFGDATAARLLADQLRPYTAYPGALGLPTVLFVGAMAGPYGRALAHAGELAEAEAALRGAIAADLALGARPYVVLSQLALADVLRRRGDADAAVPIASAAATQARRLDMPGPLARADRLLTTLAATRRAVDPLTAREHEVAALLAKAQSNRQIAAALVLSERTVESHVRNILAKLGCANRAELLASGRLPTAAP
ncbi:helix-turn-helix transcriptional regulator [Frankia sp. AgB32]|uniref:helix-turn-helix transcriptional regulator n=1 Tax=Frankia sp. AgB32 TaxID=631119 RepID=UPI00200EF01B|nr:helix-turn-helix transcriptional regulator [Frankia sp. AgB32]MCK9896847.1 helix-turn-helix transcriptional regulator [Frankia sp. AgB32]